MLNNWLSGWQSKEAERLMKTEKEPHEFDLKVETPLHMSAKINEVVKFSYAYGDRYQISCATSYRDFQSIVLTEEDLEKISAALQLMKKIKQEHERQDRANA